jgi:peptidyl-prolyl cis-trans isomerase D
MIKFLQSGGKTTKYLLGGMLLILCGSMVTFLIPGFMSDSTASASGAVASVAGHNIQMADVQSTAARLVQQQMRQGYPEFYRQMLMQQSVPMAVNDLMQNEEIRYECDRLGLRVSDQELQDALRTGPDGPYFFPEGKWVGQEKYEQMLRNAQMTPDFYEQSLRLGLLKQKLFATITAGVDVSPAELQKSYKEQNTKIKFDYAVITKEDLEKQVKTNDTELKAFYAKNKSKYENSIPEKRQVRYFVIDRKQAEAKVTVTPSDQQQYYGTHQNQYKTQERVKARHILINTPVPGPDGKVDEKAVEAARTKATDILKQLKNGADFAEMARKYSQDSTAKDGGELGWTVKGQGQMAAQFEDAAFAMSKGQMSDVVQNSFGFEIIQVEDKEDAHVKPFSEVRDEVEKAVKVQKAGDWLGQTVETAQAQARAETLDKAAAKVGSQVVLSNPIAMNDSLPGVGSAPDFTQAVFSTAPKSGPQAARFGDGVAVFEVTRIDPPKTPEFDSIKDRVTKDFKSEQADHKLQTTLQEMADRAHAEHDLRKAAKEAGATVKTSNLVAGKDDVPDIGSMNGQAREAFNLKPGEISGPITIGNKGVVIALTERQEPSAEEAAKGSDEVREQLIERKRQQEFGIFLSTLRTRLEKEGKEKIYKSTMESLTKGRG